MGQFEDQGKEVVGGCEEGRRYNTCTVAANKTFL